MVNIQLPPWAIRALTKIMKAFLWTGTEVLSNGKCMVAWPLVQCPLHLGGLGILDLELFGYALRLRWLWTQRIGATTITTTRRLRPPPSDEFFTGTVLF